MAQWVKNPPAAAQVAGAAGIQSQHQELRDALGMPIKKKKKKKEKKQNL